MKVKDYEVKGSSAKEVLEGIMEEHTNAKVSRISEEQGRICMHENCIGRIACVYKRGSLVYKLASDTCVVFSSDNLRITPIMKGE